MLTLHHKNHKQEYSTKKSILSNSNYTKVSLCIVFRSTKPYSSQQKINNT